MLLPTSHATAGCLYIPAGCEHGSWQLTPDELRAALRGGTRTFLVERHIPRDHPRYLDDGAPWSWTDAERGEVLLAVETAFTAGAWPPPEWPPPGLSPYRVALLEARVQGVLARAARRTIRAKRGRVG